MGYKKLDEVMELLSDELDGFGKSIIKLEKLTQNTENIKIKVDTSDIEYLLKEHLRAEKERSDRLQEVIKSIANRLSKSSVIPKVQLWIHYTIYFISIVIIGYLIFSQSELTKKHETDAAKTLNLEEQESTPNQK
mgnify:CR=1 FL=1|tara:strand:+ start:940 stop:1344 length:405 start_codon:yes stop_codon:yes gene_type:complete